MLPAASCGLDVRALRAGVNAMLQHTLRAPVATNLPVQGALYGVRQEAQGRTTHTIMPYVDTLEKTAAWCRQLISESLGKQGKGITPLAAMGTVDQHSMLQLLLDGRDDKYFTVIVTEQVGRGAEIPTTLAALAGLSYLGGKPLGDVLDAFQKGTIGSIQGSKRPVRTIHMPKVDAFHLGALLMYFMLETVLIAQMIGVDAFDQPAVEDSKIRAKKVLGV
jgi:glucose-6-phosphate isomerase